MTSEGRKIDSKKIDSALKDSTIIEPIMMVLKNIFVNKTSYSREIIAESLSRYLEDEKAFFDALIRFELNHYEVYLGIEDRILPLKQFFFKGSKKEKPKGKKKFRNTRLGRIASHLPAASFLYHYLSFIASLPNAIIAFLTGLAIPFCSQAMKNRLKKSVIYIKTNHPLIQWLKRIFNKKIIDRSNSKHFVKNILGRWLFVHEDIEVPAPYFISISPSTVCNLRCIGCYAGEYNNATLTKEQVNDLLAQTREIGTQIVCFTGGEPLLYPHFYEVIESNEDLFFLVFTNGTHIDEEACKRIKQLGNIAILMSIEGDEVATDARRGKGVFQKVMNSSALLKEHRIMFGYSIMAASNNGEDITNIDFYKKLVNCGAMILWFSTYLPVGNDRSWELLPSPDQRLALKKALQEVRRTMPVFIIDFENDSSYIGGCTGAGRRVVHINSKGQIEPCNFFHFYQHTIDEVPIAKAINSSFFQIVREHQPFCNCGYTPCLFDCNIDALNSILAAGRCKPSYPNDNGLWTNPDYVNFSVDYRNKIQGLYLQDAIQKFAGESESD